MCCSAWQVVLAIDCDCEYFVVNELQQWNFFGLHHSNVVLLPLPRFHGFAQVGLWVAWRDAGRAACASLSSTEIIWT